jgi:hypothetical protein
MERLLDGGVVAANIADRVPAQEIQIPMSLCIPEVLPLGTHKESIETDGSQHRSKAWIDMLCE